MKQLILIAALLASSSSWGDCISGNCTNGIGTFTWADGEKYVGEYQDNKRHGQGTYTYASGNKYVGEWKDNNKHGQGTFTWADGEKYVGEWKDNNMHGQGTYTYASGNKYVGEWKDDKKHGQGTMTYKAGETYSGNWINGKYQNNNINNQPNRDLETRALINLGAIIGGFGTPAPSSTRSKVITPSYPTYTSSITVPSNQLCPLLVSRLVKQEVVRGNRICYYQ